MDEAKKFKGWLRALRKMREEYPPVLIRGVRAPKLTTEQAIEIEQTRQRNPKPRLTVHSNLVGIERGQLLVWNKMLGEALGTIPFYMCLCGCGEYKEFNAHSLLRGWATHCGCRQKERERVRAWRRKRRLAKIGRKRGHWKRFVGMVA